LLVILPPEDDPAIIPNIDRLAVVVKSTAPLAVKPLAGVPLVDTRSFCTKALTLKSAVVDVRIDTQASAEKSYCVLAARTLVEVVATAVSERPNAETDHLSGITVAPALPAPPTMI
jgi:hypothetical protein